MVERSVARDQLRRILYLLAAAGGPEGAPLEAVSESLEVAPAQVLRDLEEVTARVYYHPSGGADEFQISVERERVRIRTTGEFRRPARLSPREALALGLGLRVLAAESDGERREALTALAERLEKELATAPPEALRARYAVQAGDPAGRELLSLLGEAARERRRCRLRYLKPGAREAEEHALEPYAVVSAAGRWYAMGRDPERDGVRAFRLDRILEAEETDEPFEPPEDFDPAEYVADGRVYRAREDSEVVVRYSPRIARWILERGAGVEQPDGGAVAAHRVADPGWAVRHVLRYGAEAELLSPADLRALVRDTAERVKERHAA
ncbi:MAG: helix-turn-helix transcriptional regulator [Gemmatimonadota bacterium]